MVEQYESQITDEDLAASRELTRRGTTGVVPALALVVGLASLGGGSLVAALLPDASLAITALACGLAGALVGVPFLVVIVVFTKKRGLELSIETTVRQRVMETEARRREFETRLARALEMSDDQPAAFDVIQRAMRTVMPDVSAELLLADNSHAHLERLVVASADGEPPGCPVDSPDQCIAARRAQTQIFADSEDLDSCPLLRGRECGPCSGVCVPVSIMGRTVGVLHAVDAVRRPLDDARVSELQTLSNQAGNRLGMLRVMAETQAQAATDGLTGLINRRSLENRVRQLRSAGTELAFVMADLDHFKAVNDSYGHETGDRALRIFAEILRQELRADDLACRYGGEEFAIVLPGADVHDAVEIIERMRDGLAQATTRGDAPSFTSSFGIAHSQDAVDFEDLVQRADKALFHAKDAGRDRVCIDGHATPVAPSSTALG